MLIRSAISRLAIAGIALAVLQGCAVGPNYVRPAPTAVPAQFAGAAGIWKVAQPRAQLPRGNWWEMFGDPELNSLEEQALASNQQLEAAVQRFFEARDTVAQTRSGLFPDLSLPASFEHNRISPNRPRIATGLPIGHPTTYNDFITGLDLGYEVDLWGLVRRSVESSRAQFQATADDLGTLQLEIQADVAVDYFSLRALDAEQAVLTSSVSVFSKSYNLTTNRFAGGLGNELEVAQAQTVLENTEAQVPVVALDRARFEHALALLVGQPASTFRLPVRVLSGAPPVIPPGLPSELLERRPDISAAERHMAAANAEIGVARAAFFPSVQLNGLAGFESLSVGTFLYWPSRFWAVGPTVNAPLFEGGRLRANLHLAQATYQEIIDNYRQTVLAAFQDVEDNLAAQNLLASQYAIQSRALMAARRQLNAANDRYQDGLVTYLEVATAETTELTIEFSTVQLRGQQFVAAVTLVKALGGSWQPPMNAQAAR
ncbi:MAG TPA: efflux transporter outer membrane subunit [Candidatus Sulfotelmatobacter sp.]|nr:efflux transporter outer membrane subunit [Candidatus Sulfotelmatobacter sp.]